MQTINTLRLAIKQMARTRKMRNFKRNIKILLFSMLSVFSATSDSKCKYTLNMPLN